MIGAGGLQARVSPSNSRAALAAAIWLAFRLLAGAQALEPAPLVSAELAGVEEAFTCGGLLLGVRPGPAFVPQDHGALVDLRRHGELNRPVLDALRAELRSQGGQPALLLGDDVDRVAAVWLALRVRDEGVPWEVALDEARRIGLRAPGLEQRIRDYVLGPEPERWRSLKREIRGKFPDARQMSVAALAARLARGGTTPLLLDVRAPDEYEVSHLAGARRASSRREALALLEGQRHDVELVLYCSVGYRSSDLAQQLRSAGFTRVRNLEGSIFEWANRGHEVVHDGRPTTLVHPYDRDWGRLLEREFWPESFR